MTRYINPCSVQFKIDKIIWKAFKSVCYYQNLETSFVLREFVKDYVTNRREIEKRERAKIPKDCKERKKRGREK